MENNTPAWFIAICIICALPLFTFPWLLGQLPAESGTERTLVWLYPFYMAFSAWLAWKAWPQRSYVSWMLLAVMIISTVAIYLLAFPL